MFRSRKHKTKHRDKTLPDASHTAPLTAPLAVAAAGPTALNTSSSSSSIPDPPTPQWTTHQSSRSLLSLTLPLSASSARPSLSPLSGGGSSSSTSDAAAAPPVFSFDLLPAPPRSVSYTSSPISPVAPVLPPIARVSTAATTTGHERPEPVKPRVLHGVPVGSGDLASASDAAGTAAPSVVGVNKQEGARVPRQDLLGSETVADLERADDAHTWSAISNERNELLGRPQTAPREHTQRAGNPAGRMRIEGRFNSDGGISPVLQRPVTAGSRHSLASPVERDGAHHEHLSVASPPLPLDQSTSMSAAIAPLLSPSNQPGSHRPPSRSNVATLSPSLPTSSAAPTPYLRPTIESTSYNPPTKTRNKRSLLNPVSLLLRRRSQQPLTPLTSESLTAGASSTKYPGLPHDFDPSIRGKIIHDFSSPKDRRAEVFSPKSFRSGSPADHGAHDEYRVERDRAPAFREHFEDTGTSVAAVRAEQLENKDFVARNAALTSLDIGTASPPFGRPKGYSNPAAVPLTLDTTFATLQPPAQEILSLSPVVEESAAVPPVTSVQSTPKRQSAIQRRTTAVTKKKSRRVSAASRISRSSIASDASYSSTTVPSHSNSRSSRFSFQLAGKDSILQEQMLEERHKQKEAARRLADGDDDRSQAEDAADGDDDRSQAEDAEDEYDFDDDMAYMEEEVPTVGDDWGYDDSVPVTGLGNMTLDGSVHQAAGAGMPDARSMDLTAMAVYGLDSDQSGTQGLGILNQSVLDGQHYTPFDNQDDAYGQPPEYGQVDDTEDILDDDLYFDDGMIDEVNFDESERFDESVLDDPSHPLYERKPKQPDEMQDTAPLHTEATVVEGDGSDFESNVTVFNFSHHANTTATPQAMADYHNILALAATKAAAAGRFDRQDLLIPISSPSELSAPQDGSSQPSLVQDDSQSSRASQVSQHASKIDGFSPIVELSQVPDVFALGSGYDTFETNCMAYDSDLLDYDSALEDDPIIAAANADALANDDDGIYGSEFGFYAKPDSEAEGVFQDGGYFGPKEWGDIKRQKSTREPNLTPITERSEFSTRNSFVQMPADKDRSSSALGLAQLARMSPHGWDGDMNMEALMKLRRGAFGGSQASLGSYGSGRDVPSSPLASSPVLSLQEARVSAHVREKSGSALAMRSILATPVESADHIDYHSEDEQDWVDASSAEESDYSSTEEIDEEDVESEEHTDMPLEKDVLPTSWSNARPSTASHLQSARPSTAMSASAQSQYDPLSSQTQSSFIRAAMQPPAFTFPAQQHAHTPVSATDTSPVLALPSAGAHSRSGSDTVAYVQEQAVGDAQPHWILERRRTGDNGIEHVVGRTRIENNMI